MNHSLTVLGGRPVERVELNSDEYVSARVRITPRSDERLVLTVDGDSGGWLELILGSADGAVEEFTVTTPLPPYQPAPLPDGLHVIPELPRLATLALLGSSREVDLQRLALVRAPLAEGARGGARCIRLGVGEPELRYESFGLAFLVGPEGGLLEFVIEQELAERARSF